MRYKSLILTLSVLAVGIMASTLARPSLAAPSDGISLEINKSQTVRLGGAAAVVSISDPEIADVNVIRPDLVTVSGRSVGQTTLTAFDQDGIEILNEDITVSHNISALNRIIKQILPDSNIVFRSIDGTLLVTGSVDSPLQADQMQRIATPFLVGSETELVNMLNILHSDQVMLKVKIAEISRNELKRFGINIASLLDPVGNFAFGIVNGRAIGGSTASSISRNQLDGGIGLDYSGSSRFDINGVIDALAEDNMIKVLAEPNLTTTSGRPASFLAGGEIPIPVPGEDGQVTIEWRQYGVSLSFTPTVLSKDKISLAVMPEVSELSALGAIELQNFSIPSITTRRAETSVELGSGQSFAIAGLMNNSSSNDVSKFPGLGEVPILGALFRSTEFQHDQTELIIIVTPYIVHGAAAQEIAAPTDGFQESNDLDRMLMGSNNVVKPAGGKPAQPVAETTSEPHATTKRRQNLSPAQRRNSALNRHVNTPERGGEPQAAASTPVVSAPLPEPEPTASTSPITAVPTAKPTPPSSTPKPQSSNQQPATGATPEKLHGSVGFMVR